MNFPVISAYVAKELGADPTRDITLVPPYVVMDREIIEGVGHAHQIRIGLIGFVPPQIMNWDRRHLEGNVHARDIVETARAYVPVMKEQGVDVNIALSHSGIGSAKHTELMGNAAVPLAAIEGIDAVLSGHHHNVFPSATYADRPAVDVANGTIHGKPAVMARFWGSHLGLIDLMLETSGAEWRVVGHSSEAHPIAKCYEDRPITALVGSDQVVLDSVAELHHATPAYVRRAVGKTSAPLHSYFALVADDPSVQIVSNPSSTVQFAKSFCFNGLPCTKESLSLHSAGRAG